MPTGGVMSPRATPARQRVCGLSTCVIGLLKKRSAGIQQRPTYRIDHENACENKQRLVPDAGLLHQRPGQIIESGSAEIAAHVHDAEYDTDASATELDGHGVTADAAEGRGKGPDAEQHK